MNKNRFVISPVLLEEGQTCSDVEVLREGVIQDRQWKITKSMLKQYVENYKADVYGTEVQVNLEHNRGSEAAGWVKDIFVRGKSLVATVDWTELGAEKIKKKLFKFVSAELAMEYPHHETGELTQNVFIGLALTNTPALKGQVALQLSEIQEFNQNCDMFKKHLEFLKSKAVVSLEEKDHMRVLLEELPEAEKEAVQSDVAEVEAKPEEAVETEEQKAEREKKEAEAAAAAQKAADDAQALAQKEQEIATLNEKLKSQEKTALLTAIESNVSVFMLSDTNKTGFVQAKSKEKLVNFLSSLNDEQRAEAMSLLAEVLSVELGEKGKTGTVDLRTKEQKEDQKLADQKVRAQARATEKGIAYHVALGEVIAEDESLKQ